MSGGSFNYLYSKLEDDPFGHLGQLQDMVDFLKNSNEPEAAKELQNLLSYLEKTKQEVFEKAMKFQWFVRTVEWEVSNDIGKGGIQTEFIRFLLSEGRPIDAIRYYRRVHNLQDHEGFLKAKEEVNRIKEEMK